MRPGSPGPLGGLSRRLLRFIVLFSLAFTLLASAVQLYSALIFEGPGLIARMLDELDGLLAAEGLDSVAEAVGTETRQSAVGSRQSS